MVVTIFSNSKVILAIAAMQLSLFLTEFFEPLSMYNDKIYISLFIDALKGEKSS
jgi:hypothetical protein